LWTFYGNYTFSSQPDNPTRLDMSLRLTADTIQVAAAINGFSSGYHAGYFDVRQAARLYLDGTPDRDNARELAGRLLDVLTNWKAGQRGGPRTKPLGEVVDFLLLPEVHDALRLMETRSSLHLLGVNEGRRTVNALADGEAAASFDSRLLELLQVLAMSLFANNTNVTYPMKALLLITGLMPALDSQVRTGLGRVGFTGVDKSQFLLPRTVNLADGAKLTRLPFMLGQCFQQDRAAFETSVCESKYPQLISEPGRLFDVLFFMQADLPDPLFTFNPTSRIWYQIH
jgi:hypothetical protein